MSRGRVCFVCGSLGAEATLHTKPHDKSPYFPFLEHHDPPKGSRIPGNDGVVDSCRVCYAFLTQQWETYERSRTPAIKRLYWLKRMDNGHFTGAEMRLQGEYIAQVMGLQYQPGVFEGGQSPNPSREGGSPNYQEERDITSYSKEKPVYTSQVENKPYRQEARIAQVNSMYANVPPVTVPVSLAQRPAQRNFSDGALDLSVSKKASGNASKSSSQDCDAFICYICAKEHDVSKSKLVNSCLQPTKEPYFPVIEKIPMPPHALPLTSSGQARVCVTCKNSLYQQWQAYEMSGIPIQHRTYKLYEDISHVSRHSESRQSKDIPAEFGNQSSSIQHVCYICGHLNQEENVRLLYTIPPKDPAFGTLFFPFVRDLRRPHGAQPLKSDGTVLVCKSCYGGIYQQWQAQELSGIPLQHRQYSLSFLRKKVNEHSENHAKEKIDVNPQENDKSPPSSSSSDVSQPLNIQISENGESSSHMNSSGSQGLLAIAAPSAGVNTGESNPTGNSGFMARRGSGDARVNVTTVPVPHPLQQATELPKRICFLCGEESLVTKAHILCSYPPRHETKGSNSQVVPFFPFLANKDAAPGAEPMSDDGTVISCNFCFSSLLRQWNEQEESKNPENNRWLRKYAEPDFVCFVCAKNIKRKNVRPLELKNFPFLREHKFPSSALLLDGGEHVAACKVCTYSLMHQFNEFERMGVPKEMRKYNWMQSGQGDDENSKDQEEDSNEHSNKAYMLNVDEDSNDVTDEGLPPGSKPPPLTMISPAASKLSRNTATVPPLNQVSPSNGVNSVAASSALNASRTSSFAAALRKLAQAKDPAEEGSVKQSGSTSTSPRATTPKRGPPPPLVYTTQSSTSLTSPPVVTIAPTQSHSSIVSADMRQSIDRAHSVQSSVSSAYDQPLALKQERIERPQSTHSNSRDDDRLSVKDLQNSRSSRLTPHSGQRSSSPSSGLRDEAIVRGFQPYRPGDDVRHSLPPTYGLDPSAYPYPAFLPPHPFPHPAFRFDDPLLLERYRMMQPHYLPFAHPGLLPPTGVHPFLAGGRYPAELLHQQIPFASQASTLPDQIAAVLTERQRLEEERLREYEREREREKDREAILLREKEKARDREKEYDKERSKEQYQQQHSIEHRTEKKIDHTGDRENHKDRISDRDVSYERNMHNNRDRGSEQDRCHHHLSESSQRSRSESGALVEHRSRSEDDISRRCGSITQGTPRDSSYGERSTIPLPSNISEQYYNSNKRKEEKIHYNHLKGGQSSQKAVNLDLIKQEYDREKRYTDRDNSRSNHSNNDLLLKSGKNSDSFFRPFDTLLTNGYSGSDVSGEMDKYSSSTQKTDDRKRHHDKTKTSHVEPYYHRQSSGELTKTNSSNGNQNSSSEFSFANYLSQMKQMDMQQSNMNKTNFKHIFPHQKNSSSSSSSSQKQQESSLSSSSHVKKENLESQVVSKLDLDEKSLMEKRAQSDYVSESDSESDDSTEERRQVRLMMITTGIPLQLDESKKKLNYLSQLGLTSLRVKKELEYEKFRKRRKFHRERSISPVQADEEPLDRISSPLRIPPDEKSEELSQERDFPDKCSFLGSFSLGCIESSKKKELQQIRSVCDRERYRRLSGQISDNSTSHGCKRKSDSSCDSECEISTKKCLTSSEHNKLSGDTQNHVSDSLNRPFNLQDSSKTVLFPEHRDHKVLSRFAQEFHESVLQTTRQKEINNRLGLGHSRSHDHTDSIVTPPVLPRTTNDAIGSSSRSHDHSTDKYKWPGMEVLLGAYQRHFQEQNLEKKVLMDRCRQLQNDNKDLNRMAESLNRRMDELMENKRLVDQSRNSCQSAIENIKQSMKALR